MEHKKLERNKLKMDKELTGAENEVARIAYAKLGYCEDAELHLAKRITRE